MLCFEFLMIIETWTNNERNGEEETSSGFVTRNVAWMKSFWLVYTRY